MKEVSSLYFWVICINKQVNVEAPSTSGSAVADADVLDDDDDDELDEDELDELEASLSKASIEINEPSMAKC